MSNVEKFVGQYEANLRTLVEIPSVSSEPEHHKDINHVAEFGAELFEQAGLTAQLIETDGNPVVHGEHFVSSSAPTVIVYNHLDVQPVNKDEWDTPPFKLVERDGSYYGRGTTDDKGPALAVLCAAHQAIRAQIPLNFQFVWETEEEIGSPNFPQALDQLADKLDKADSVLISDTEWVSEDQPTITYGLRGLVAFELSCVTGDHDTHSGTTGGLALNPAHMLTKAIASMTNEDDTRVLIPHFYDGVAPVTEAEIDALIAAGFSIEKFIKDNGLSIVKPLDQRDAVQAIKTKPTLDISGIETGTVVPGAIKTIIPHSATAQGSARIVPGQNPAKVFESIADHVSSTNPGVNIRHILSAEPFLTELGNPHLQTAAQSIRELGLVPAFDREGGTIGAAVYLGRFSKAVVMVGLSLPTDGYHAPKEHFSRQQAQRGIQLFTDYFMRIAQIN